MTQQTIEVKDSASIDQNKLKDLAEKTIFFGHQSVGKNILDGIESIQSDFTNKLTIKKLENYSDASPKALNHFQVGKNYDPFSKMDDFYEWMAANKDMQIDIAFLKFCYVDILENSEPKKVFDAYNNMVEKIKKIHPETQIIHFTNPLMAYNNDIKNFIKAILNQPRTGYQDNIKRLEYNTMLRDSYSNAGTLFDIAKFESTNPEGLVKLQTIKNDQFEILLNEYTNDGGHLNQKGQKHIGNQLLYFLTNRN